MAQLYFFLWFLTFHVKKKILLFLFFIFFLFFTLCIFFAIFVFFSLSRPLFHSLPKPPPSLSPWTPPEHRTYSRHAHVRSHRAHSRVRNVVPIRYTWAGHWEATLQRGLWRWQGWWQLGRCVELAAWTLCGARMSRRESEAVRRFLSRKKKKNKRKKKEWKKNKSILVSLLKL